MTFSQTPMKADSSSTSVGCTPLSLHGALGGGGGGESSPAVAISVVRSSYTCTTLYISCCVYFPDNDLLSDITEVIQEDEFNNLLLNIDKADLELLYSILDGDVMCPEVSSTMQDDYQVSKY